MPVTDHDELLAQADRYIAGMAYEDDDILDLVEGLAAALRAALAARPQADAIIRDLAHVNPRHVTAIESLQARALAVVYPATQAAAGSATPAEQAWVDDVFAMFDERHRYQTGGVGNTPQPRALRT